MSRAIEIDDSDARWDADLQAFIHDECVNEYLADHPGAEVKDPDQHRIEEALQDEPPRSGRLDCGHCGDPVAYLL